MKKRVWADLVLKMDGFKEETSAAVMLMRIFCMRCDGLCEHIVAICFLKFLQPYVN
ncbi:hypothetical protein HanRHA438_Chr16g0784881 [Helianthus annuus]|nr:hypothetical protein HanHA300_Chr16g0631291 [Helianthus annuus]KAJ0462352.1 hypothetical protein HanHA89_Chr16g0682451 [Helianthus annuus]KAJ0642758.1 hypothetical protein HanLR1_Chr16g0641891 [Helianthus annuus]KAJ0646629.1 hypothetical protein HanOQP8_Chr16g0637291 [Helianthus annuus]KAJ0823352.1 hypothetical protein HanPSC8_Chr16g0742721 [Helianthus annuus]